MNSLQFDLIKRVRAGEFSGASEMSEEQLMLYARFVRNEWAFPLSSTGGVPRLTERGLSALSAHQDKIDREAQQHAQRDAERKADRANALFDKKQERRHDFAVAAFGGAVALFFEHLGDIKDFVQPLVEKIFLLFH